MMSDSRSAGETPAAPPDPWELVKRLSVDTDGMHYLDPQGNYYDAKLVDAALATERQHHAAQLAEKDAELLALRAALRALVNKWTDFAFTGDEHYVPQGDGYIASTCADELDAALAASPPHPETEGQ